MHSPWRSGILCTWTISCNSYWQSATYASWGTYNNYIEQVHRGTNVYYYHIQNTKPKLEVISDEDGRHNETPSPSEYSNRNHGRLQCKPSSTIRWSENYSTVLYTLWILTDCYNANTQHWITSWSHLLQFSNSYKYHSNKSCDILLSTLFYTDYVSTVDFDTNNHGLKVDSSHIDYVL